MTSKLYNRNIGSDLGLRPLMNWIGWTPMRSKNTNKFQVRCSWNWPNTSQFKCLWDWEWWWLWALSSTKSREPRGRIVSQRWRFLVGGFSTDSLLRCCMMCWWELCSNRVERTICFPLTNHDLDIAHYFTFLTSLHPTPAPSAINNPPSDLKIMIEEAVNWKFEKREPLFYILTLILWLIYQQSPLLIYNAKC